MGKINEQTLKEASNCMHRAWLELTRFSCLGIRGEACPMRYGENCVLIILSAMYGETDTRLEEATK